jgi:hypothetical protein
MLSFLMLLSFTIALAQAIGSWTAQGADASGPFKANYVFMPLALLMVVLGSGRISVDGLIGLAFKGKKKAETAEENAEAPVTDSAQRAAQAKSAQQAQPTQQGGSGEG